MFASSAFLPSTVQGHKRRGVRGGQCQRLQTVCVSLTNSFGYTQICVAVAHTLRLSQSGGKLRRLRKATSSGDSARLRHNPQYPHLVEEGSFFL